MCTPMKKDARAGGKYTGSHTTVTPLAARICDIAAASASVRSISPGFITAGLRPLRGPRRIKIVERQGALLISVRDTTTLQELHIYTSDLESTRARIVAEAEAAGIEVKDS